MTFLRSVSFDAFADTADFADQGLTNAYPTDVVFHATNGRFGGGCCQITDDDKSLGIPISPGGSLPQTTIFGASCKVSAYPAASDHLLQYMDSNSVVNNTLILGASGLISLYTGTVFLKGTATQPVPLNEWFWLEVKIKHAGSAGTAEIRINGTTVLNLTTGDFADGLQDCGRVLLKGSAGRTTSWDDVVIMDDQGASFNDFLGDLLIETLAPTVDTAQQDFTASNAGDNFAEVDDIGSDSDAGYNYSNTVNDEDLFTHGDLSATPTAVHACVVNLKAKDTGVNRGLKASCKSGVTTSRGSEETLSGGYGFFQTIYETDPDTAAAWDGAGVDAAEFGYQVSS